MIIRYVCISVAIVINLNGCAIAHMSSATFSRTRLKTNAIVDANGHIQHSSNIVNQIIYWPSFIPKH